jgi:hypothetical protein
MEDIDTLIEGKREVKLADVLEVILRNMKHDDFILKRNYTISKRIDHSYGKWPSTYGNSFFVDSRYLLFDILEMAKINVINFLETNNYGDEDIKTT